MTSLDLTIIALNCMLAFASVAACRYGALNDDPRRRVLWGSMAALALVYAVSYAWLYANPEEVVAWSRLLRGVSLIAWPLVWLLPPLLITRQHRRDIRIVEREL